jgi:hypothetical protein
VQCNVCLLTLQACTSGRRVVEAKNTRSRIYDESVTNRDRFPSYPYVIFFKNFKMVHDPIVRASTFSVCRVVSCVAFRTHS